MGIRRKIGFAALYALFVVVMFDVFIIFTERVLPGPLVGIAGVTMAIALAFVAARFYRGGPMFPPERTDQWR